ncbi:MAG: hypothetical protein V4723_03960 [Pseudomonadota bacterium]
MLPLWMPFMVIVSGITLFCWGFADSRELYWKIRATKYVGGLILMLLGTAVALLNRSAA